MAYNERKILTERDIMKPMTKIAWTITSPVWVPYYGWKMCRVSKHM